MEAISLNNISKFYEKGKVIAVDAISFSVEKGELFGLIGPDGAGKTSILRMLTTLLLPDKGTATVNGLDIIKDYRSIRSQIGYMPGRFSLYQDLTVEENLNFFATLFDTSIEENYDLIKDIYIQIEPFKKRRAGKLSGGMKQKLALCCALIHKPVILFLDEPTTGVDAVSRREFWEMLKELKHQNITILVSTPYMDEATLCDRIALIQTGKILIIDTPENIAHSFDHVLYSVKSDDRKKLLIDLKTYAETNSCFAFGEYLHLTLVKEDHEAVERLHQYLADHKHADIEIELIKPSVEDYFIQMTSVDKLNAN
ncbi:MAG: ABC transporter ATP-binding protein [Saprospiraceae bacterium]